MLLFLGKSSLGVFIVCPCNKKSILSDILLSNCCATIQACILRILNKIDSANCDE